MTITEFKGLVGMFEAIGYDHDKARTWAMRCQNLHQDPEKVIGRLTRAKYPLRAGAGRAAGRGRPRFRRVEPAVDR